MVWVVMMPGMTTEGGGFSPPRVPLRKPGIRRYILLFLAGLIPILSLGAYAYHVASESIHTMAIAHNSVAAQLVREHLEQEFLHRMDYMETYSKMPGLVGAVQKQNREAMQERLKLLVEGCHEVANCSVMDPGAHPWCIYPPAPEAMLKTFTERDWYKGVTRTWGPYVSEVFRSAAEPHLLSVAVAAPIFDKQGAILGIVVAGIGLEGINQTFKNLEVGQGGYAMLIDPRGRLAAHPWVNLQEREYAEYADVARAGQDPSRGFEYEDPLTHQGMLATMVSCTISGNTWRILVQQPRDLAFAPLKTLGLQIGGAGVLLTLVTGGLLVLLMRSHGQVLRLNTELSSLNTALEQRVEERTRELRKTEEQFLHAQKMEAVGRLAGGVAHDFNNMLMVITGYCEMLLAGMRADDRNREMVQEVLKAGQQAEHLTRQLLAFSRKQVMRPRVIDLNASLESMKTMLQKIVGEDVDLSMTLRPHLHPVTCDPGQIEQILMNLVVNARDAMPKGGRLVIETSNVDLDEAYARTHPDARPGPHVMCSVADTGTGMDEATQKRIFEPFFTTKEVGRGTGLGLSTVYGIIKQSGGNIWVYSELGKGTVFKIYLPRSLEAPALAPEASAPAPESLQLGGGRILVVEDEEAVRRFVSSVLTKNGYRVQEAPGPQSALAIFRESPGIIDAVLSDMIMPKMNGKELADELRKIRPDIKIIFMSGYTGDTIMHHGMLDPGITLLEKPINPRKLLEALHALLA
ncbi:MAG: ATP-binding protein [Planctomycetota bacterium]